MPPALPPDFENYTLQLFGEERFARYKASFEEARPVSIRLNPFKPGKKVLGEAVPWCDGGVWMSAREEFTLDPLLHAGCYYVQDAAGMFLDLILRQLVREPVTMLDLCAAPGGKATLARAALPDGSRLFCNETDRQRVNILAENIIKQGHPDVVVTNNFARDFRRSGMLFDVILADVPCSGEGMFRRDENAIGEWSVGGVMRCAELQKSIVADIWPCLKPGGLLVYSTCTFNARENEENVRWIAQQLGAELVSIEIENNWGITKSLVSGFNQPVYRFIPGLTRSEGMFWAAMRKTGGETAKTKKQNGVLRVVHDGRNIVQTADSKRPPHAEALLYNLPENRYPRTEIPRETALDYLRREAIRLDSNVPRGFVIVCFEGHPLGFVKNLGTRANNLYPQAWRIRNK
ncbi:MAG: hypothetical protein LUC26_05420 [Prevotella sp.]|nr:hypothetical protein [Prevotella sp.]